MVPRAQGLRYLISRHTLPSLWKSWIPVSFTFKLEYMFQTLRISMNPPPTPYRRTQVLRAHLWRLHGILYYIRAINRFLSLWHMGWCVIFYGWILSKTLGKRRWMKVSFIITFGAVPTFTYQAACQILEWTFRWFAYTKRKISHVPEDKKYRFSFCHDDHCVLLLQPL
jgi:hypothetical protein